MTGRARSDGHVLDEPAERPELVGPDLLRVGHARDHAPGVDQREDRVQARAEERDDAQPEVEDRPDEAADDPEQQREPENDDRAPQAVAADLLLERHVAGVNDTCGTSVSPLAEKNSLARKPSGFATRTQGMLWIPVL